MPVTMIQAPVPLLRDPALSPADQVLWLALRIPPVSASPSVLANRSGLTRPTVRKSLARLASAGWYSLATGALDRPFASPMPLVPADLLADVRVRPGAKLLYAILQTLPTCHNNAGTFTYAAVSEHAQVSTTTARHLVRELAAAGWLVAKQANQKAPIKFALSTPTLDQHSPEVARAKVRLTEQNYSGEALMKEYLSLLIASEEFEDNARPGFLVNPQTEERLELDRYYLAGVAFEYNGPQHYRTTKRFPNPRKVAAQQTRDLIKEALCARRGIRLVVIHHADLSLERMRQKVGTLLPLRDLKGHEVLIQFLDQLNKK